jgi:photosystem II stability/assembly factor-like uncharacterized protein
MKRYRQPRHNRWALLALLLTLCLPRLAQAQGHVTWQQTAGPVGGAVLAIALHPQAPQRLFAGCAPGLYLSDNGGSSWQRVREGTFGCQDIQALALDPQDAQVAFAGTTSGLYRSLDAGASWSRMSTGLSESAIWSVAVHALYPQVVYVGTAHAVFRSLDRGSTWEYADGGLPKGTIFSLAIHPENPYIVYAGTDDAVWMTVDGGLSWHATSAGLSVGGRISVVAIDPLDAGHLYAGTPDGLYASVDSGSTWHLVQGAAPAGAILAIALGAGELQVGGASGTIMRSADGGASWARLPAVPGNPLITGIAIAQDETTRTLVATNLGCYILSWIEGQWQSRQSEMVNADVRVLTDVPDTRGALYAATAWDLYRTDDSGANWSFVSRGPWSTDLGWLAIDQGDTDQLYACTQQGALYRSTDAGATWQYLHAPLAQGIQPTGLVVCRYPKRTGMPLVYLASAQHGLYQSMDQGESWRELDLAPTVGRSFTTMVVIPGPEQYLLLGTGNVVCRLTVGLFAPNSETVSSRALDDRISSLVADTYRPGVVYAATQSGAIWKSADSGVSWLTLSGNTLAANLSVDRLLLFPHKAGAPTLGAITDAGLFFSEDEGRNWSTTGTSCLRLEAVHCAQGDDREADVVYLGTKAGVYRGQRVAQRPPPLAILGLIGFSLAALGAVIALSIRRYGQAPALPSEVITENWEMWAKAIDRSLLAHGQVTFESLAEIPPAFRLLAARRFVGARRDRALVFHEEPLLIEPLRREPLQQFTEQWRQLVAGLDDAHDAMPAAMRLTEQLCLLLGFTPIESRPLRDLFGYMVKAPTVRLAVPQRFPIIFALSHHLGAGFMRDVRDLMRVLDTTSFFALLVIIEEPVSPQLAAQEARRLCQSGSAEDFIVLDYPDLASLFLATDASRRLIEIILSQVDLTIVSPYIVAGSVPDNMFFGRDYELKAIMRTVRDKSFAIVGGRRIGKTSVLTQVNRMMQQSGGFAALYLDCQYITDYKSFFAAFSLTFEVELATGEPDALRHVLLWLRQRYQGRALVMLLDEVDRLLVYDQQNDYRLFLVFRALSQEGLCRFVFCGERHLYAGLHDPLSPLFNFCSTMQLSYLLPRDAQRIIQEPMAELGILFADEGALVPEIMALSSCHPNVIQQVCQMLLQRVGTRGDHMIQREDLAAVRDSDAFQEFLLEVTWGNATLLERLITVLLAPREAFTLEDVRQALEPYGLADMAAVREALQGLELYSVLTRQGHEYRFGARSFQQLLTTGAFVPSLREGLLESLRLDQATEP